MARILIADDEEVVRDFARRILEEDNHTILEASNGNEVIRILKDERIDLLITDLVMPGKGGMEILMELKSNQPGLKIMVIEKILSKPKKFREEVDKEISAEKQILNLSKDYPTLTLKDIVILTSLEIDEAEKAIAILIEKGFIKRICREGGKEIYDFS